MKFTVDYNSSFDEISAKEWLPAPICKKLNALAVPEIVPNFAIALVLTHSPILGTLGIPKKRLLVFDVDQSPALATKVPDVEKVPSTIFATLV